MLDNPYYSQEGHGPWQTFNAGDLTLEAGGVLRSLKLAYAVHGELNAARDKAKEMFVAEGLEPQQVMAGIKLTKKLEADAREADDSAAARWMT